jgi:glycosyltransferase involved in cell wall biosynthesis
VPDGQVADCFAAADLALFLYPSPVSASGALALALAHGTPFLLSPEMGETTGAPQALVGPRDPAALGVRLRELARDARRLDALRTAAHELGSERTWPAVARRHLDIYEEVSHADRRSRGGLRATQSG